MFERENTKIEICKQATFTLHSPFEMPDGFDTSDYCTFDYQKVITVSIIPEVIFTDESLRSIDPEKRNCFFDGEKELKYFKIYTKRNCETECFAELAMKTCNCTPFYFVREETTPLCYLKNALCISSSRATPKSLRYCGCLERCNSIKYRFEVYSDRLSVNYNPK